MVRGEVPSRDVFRIVPEGGIGWNWGHGRTRPENLASHRGLMVLQKLWHIFQFKSQVSVGFPVISSLLKGILKDLKLWNDATAPLPRLLAAGNTASNTASGAPLRTSVRLDHCGCCLVGRSWGSPMWRDRDQQVVAEGSWTLKTWHDCRDWNWACSVGASEWGMVDGKDLQVLVQVYVFSPGVLGLMRWYDPYWIFIQPHITCFYCKLNGRFPDWQVHASRVGVFSVQPFLFLGRCSILISVISSWVALIPWPSSSTSWSKPSCGRKPGSSNEL